MTQERPLTMAEVSRAVLVEQAEALEDVLHRRLHLFTQAADQGLGCARAVAEHMATLLQRPPSWVAKELALYEELVERSRLGERALAESSPQGP